MNATAPDQPRDLSWRRTRDGVTLTAKLRFIMHFADGDDPIFTMRLPGADFGTLCPYAGHPAAFNLVPLAPPQQLAATKFTPRELLDTISALRRTPADVTHIDVFHPIVIASAPLLTINDDGALTPAGAVRIERQRIASGEREWFDLVSDAAWESVITASIRWYSRFYERRKAERI